MASAPTEIEGLYQKMPELDDRFQRLSNEFYSAYVKKHSVGNWRGFGSLASGLDGADHSVNLQLLALVRNNIQAVCADYAHSRFSDLMALLYENNETATLQKITECLNESGDSVAQAENYFQQAKYYYARGLWQAVIAALSRVKRNELAIVDAHYADLLHGYALQAQKKHREAVKIYKLIPASSPWYAYAKLNQGIAYLRQGWWTEAQYEFKEAIKSSSIKDADDFSNRVLVVLGYSQLHHEFYRDARATLRQVTLDSHYTNKALMGLGLSAAYQADYGGAINAFTRLASNSENDLSVDESYLLVPNTYEELGDINRAADAYLQAIEHYKKRVNQLNLARAQLAAQQQVHIPALLESLDARSAELYGENNLIPPYILKNYHMILAMQANAAGLGLDESIQNLAASYDETLKRMVEYNIALRERILSSYLSQAKYGVAKLYDQ